MYNYNQEVFDKYFEAAKRLEIPFQELADLNAKTLQDMRLLRPEDMFNAQKPQELLDKQIELTLANCRNCINYMQKSYIIFEKSLQKILKETRSAKEKETK